jgi:hypothetical protein
MGRVAVIFAILDLRFDRESCSVNGHASDEVALVYRRRLRSLPRLTQVGSRVSFLPD